VVSSFIGTVLTPIPTRTLDGFPLEGSCLHLQLPVTPRPGALPVRDQL
jgi:hypothetical protein